MMIPTLSEETGTKGGPLGASQANGDSSLRSTSLRDGQDSPVGEAFWGCEERET